MARMLWDERYSLGSAGVFGVSANGPGKYFDHGPFDSLLLQGTQRNEVSSTPCIASVERSSDGVAVYVAQGCWLGIKAAFVSGGLGHRASAFCLAQKKQERLFGKG